MAKIKSKTESRFDYKTFLEGPARRQWKKISLNRRSGVVTPLFSLYSQDSTGIGEYPDLFRMIDWCVRTGNSLLQLLPVNDVGHKFTPYDAESSFALEPMYLAPEALKGIRGSEYRKRIEAIRKEFPCGPGRVNYGIKHAKMDLFFDIFRRHNFSQDRNFQSFVRRNRFWLENYVLYKVIKEDAGQAGWEHWEAPLRNRDSAALEAVRKQHRERMQFFRWLQWQCYEQFLQVKRYAESKDIVLMGDLPFLVSRDSADVWSWPGYFKLELLAGAPPDAYFAKGQRWGMPPYNWAEIEAHDYDYLAQKLRYAQNFYDTFRIDHAVGMFRIWTIEDQEPEESGGLNGRFDPVDEAVWEEHGKRILTLMLKKADVLPCAEDLGTVPECSYKVLREFGIPGMDVQRWMREWGKSYDFSGPESYRLNSIAVVTTHDMTPLTAWWEHEAGSIDEVLCERKCREQGIDLSSFHHHLFDPERSRHGRLFWHPDVGSEADILRILNLPEDRAWFFLDQFRSTHNEKAKYLKYLYPEGGVTEISEPGQRADLALRAIRRANESASIFSAHLLQDWLSTDPEFDGTDWEFRINFPGTMGPQNWSLRMPWSLEELLDRPGLPALLELNRQTARL